jgi:type VI secretion system secreted protein VgrG
MARNLRIHFDVDGVPAERVVRLREQHRLGRAPALEVEVRWSEYIALGSLLGHAGRLEVAFGDETPHVFVGIVEEAAVSGTSMTSFTAHQYTLRVVPKIALLARSVDAVIYQEKDVQEIVTEVLERHGISAFEWRLTGSYPKRVYCVQYQESGLDFIHRMIEGEGIYYFVEAGDDGDTVIFADDSPSADAIVGEAELPVRGRNFMAVDHDYALIPSDRERVRSGKFTLRDYNFEKPALDLTSEAEADVDTDLEVYDYPGEYDDPGEGERLAKVRLEAEQAWRRSLEMKAVCPRLAAGRTMSLSDAGDLDGEYFIVEASHELVDLSRDEEEAVDFRSEVTLIPKDVPYRLRATTRKPLIEGPQNARVVAPAGSQPEAIHTEEHGRCKVKFPWDRSDVMDDKASCWMRVSQLQTSGSLVLPRIDWEVIVEHLEGNPDRPIITGRLYNGAFMPPYSLPDGKTRTSLQTRSSPGGGGTNEIRFEDKAGSEEIMIHAQKDMTLATANNKKKTVGNNETTVIGANSTLSVGANQAVKVTMGTQNTIGANQTVSVGGNRTVEVNAVTGLTVHGSASTSVGGDQMEMIGNALEGLLAVAAQRAQEFLEAKANEAIAAVQGHVQGAVNQALGPINQLTSQAEALGSNMQAIQNGDLSAVGGLVGDASGIPGAGDFARSLGGPPSGPAGGPLAGAVAGGNMIQSAANNAVQAGGAAARSAASQAIGSGVGAAHQALASALGVDATGGGGASMDNAAGPDGEVSGQDETDRAKGPGHSIGRIAGDYGETVGGMKIQGVLNGMDTNVGGSMTQNAGAAHVEVIIGNRAESADGSKNETALGLVVLSKGGESESVKGSRTTMVGGAIIDKLKGSHQVSAGAPATFIAAYHKLEAKGKITLKCGASELVIDGGGITVTSPLVTMMAGKIHLPKDVSEN